MRSTFDIIDAVMNNKPDISEEELRLCIVSMHHTTTLTFQRLARWAAKDSRLNSIDRVLANQLWKGRKDSWNVPLDKRVEPHNRPGNPEYEHRKALSKKVVEKALGKDWNKKGGLSDV